MPKITNDGLAQNALGALVMSTDVLRRLTNCRLLLLLFIIIAVTIWQQWASVRVSRVYQLGRVAP